MKLRWLSLLPLFCACSSTETSVFLTIEPASQQSYSLRVQLFGNGLIGSPTEFALGQHPLPGTMIIRHIDSTLPNFRVLVDGLDETGAITSQGARAIQLHGGEEVKTTVQLVDGTLADSDGDGVPDVIDDCPTVADPEQTCQSSVRDLGAYDLHVVASADGGSDMMLRTDLAGVDLGSVAACPAGALFCDDFESGDTSKWSGSVAGAGITIAVDTANPLHGTHALHVQSTGGTSTAWLRQILSCPSECPITSGIVSLRVFLFSPAAFNSPLYFLFLHRDSGDDDFVAGLDTETGSTAWTMFDKNQGTYTTSNASFAAGSWHCVEFEIGIAPVDMGAAQNVAKLYIDGNAPTVWNLAPNASTTTIAEMDVGVTYQDVGSGVTNDFFIDDVALSTQHIGCE